MTQSSAPTDFARSRKAFNGASPGSVGGDCIKDRVGVGRSVGIKSVAVAGGGRSVGMTSVAVAGGAGRSVGMTSVAVAGGAGRSVGIKSVAVAGGAGRSVGIKSVAVAGGAGRSVGMTTVAVAGGGGKSVGFGGCVGGSDGGPGLIGSSTGTVGVGAHGPSASQGQCRQTAPNHSPCHTRLLDQQRMSAESNG